MKSSPTHKEIENMHKKAYDNTDADLFLKLAEVDPSFEHILLAKQYAPQHPFFANDNMCKYIKTHAKELSDSCSSVYVCETADWLLKIIANIPEFKKIVLDSKVGGNINSKFSIFLSHAQYIETLCIPSAYLEGSRMYSTHAEHLANGLLWNTSLRFLNISYQPIGDRGLLAILEALKQNPQNKLEKLWLSNCSLTDVSAKVLLDYLKENNSLLNAHVISYGKDARNHISDDLIKNIDLAVQQKKLSANAKNSQIDIIIDEPSPGPITYAYMESKNNEQEIEMTNTNDMDCISKKRM